MSELPFKVYAVCSYAWQYDDQNHYNDGEGSCAEVAYMSEQRAKDECRKRNRAALKGCDIGDYSNEGVRPYLDSDDDTAKTAFVLWANETFGTKWGISDRELVVPKDLNDAALDLLMGKMSLRFFEVVTIPFDPDTSIVAPPDLNAQAPAIEEQKKVEEPEKVAADACSFCGGPQHFNDSVFRSITTCPKQSSGPDRTIFLED